MRDVVDPDEKLVSFLSGGVDSSYMLAKSRATVGYCASYADQEASERRRTPVRRRRISGADSRASR